MSKKDNSGIECRLVVSDGDDCYFIVRNDNDEILNDGKVAYILKK